MLVGEDNGVGAAGAELAEDAHRLLLDRAETEDEILGVVAMLRLPLAARAGGRAGAAGGGVGSWIVSVTYAVGADHTRGPATFTGDGGFIGSVSAFEADPITPTPTQGSTLHGTRRRTGDGTPIEACLA